MKSEMEVDGTGFGDLNTQSLQTYRRRIKDYNPISVYNDLDDEQFCIKTGIISRGKLTYGGLLMLGKGEIVQEYVPHFWIDYIEIPGQHILMLTAVIHTVCLSRKISGNISRCSCNGYACMLTIRLCGPDGFSPEDNSSCIVSGGACKSSRSCRLFQPDALCHKGINDRIEFQNPGRFAVRISDKPGKVKSVPRNPNIIAFFRYARQGENAGYGIDKIMRWTKLTGLEVDFESDITSSTVTYPLPSQKGGQKGGQINIDTESIYADNQCNTHDKGGQKEVVRNSGQNQGEETRARIVEAMRKKPEISRRELADIIGISPSAIQKHIEHLKETEIIIRLGSDRKGLWKVLK